MQCILGHKVWHNYLEQFLPWQWTSEMIMMMIIIIIIIIKNIIIIIFIYYLYCAGICVDMPKKHDRKSSRGNLHV